MLAAAPLNQSSHTLWYWNNIMNFSNRTIQIFLKHIHLLMEVKFNVKCLQQKLYGAKIIFPPRAVAHGRWWGEVRCRVLLCSEWTDCSYFSLLSAVYLQLHHNIITTCNILSVTAHALQWVSQGKLLCIGCIDGTLLIIQVRYSLTLLCWRDRALRVYEFLTPYLRRAPNVVHACTSSS